MTPKFTEQDAQDLTRIIQRYRPTWNPKTIMQTLEQCAPTHDPGTTLTAALRAAQDPQAASPKAILFDKYWTADPKRGTPAGLILCLECLQKKPAQEITRHQGRNTCTQCKENQ